ncbi:hypothetical protein BBBOND_0208050 [Babesia bigemina]|uniref:Uncharacterized protein n=1 Tax=Babesia bigemina TaxID=5866 RepID=A0A061D4K4_BABBI|nr:hypothetical protein BBBOND_0208050 [Babesia bigemina]CDR95651.1 hypothetical protein BBBOND_0208050 [Babesia bigemina]|eukprot:XP_012767837.1 hypothetical protein BBBOND_0208050 [Babesia bigemina]
MKCSGGISNTITAESKNIGHTFVILIFISGLQKAALNEYFTSTNAYYIQSTHYGVSSDNQESNESKRPRAAETVA